MKQTNWKWIIALICVVWLAVMMVTSYVSYEQKSPVRIEKWMPEAAGRQN